MPAKQLTLRITGGEWRSRILHASPDVTTTRPTMDQARQAVFNILNSADWALKPNGQPLLMDGTILDVFAGSGAMAFEALSRGAAHATLIERDPKAIAAIQENATRLQCTAKTKIIRMDVMKALKNPGDPVTICFMDPPYQDDVWPQTVAHLKAQNWIDDKTLIVLETSSKTTRELNVALEGVLNVHDQRRYGHAFITFSIIK